MNKTDRKQLVLTSIVCVLPMLFSAVLYGKLPDQVAIHWRGDGVADGFTHRALAAFGLPFLFLLLNLFSQFMLNHDPKHNNINIKALRVAIWIVPLMSVILTPVTLLIALGIEISILLISSLLVGIVFIVVGNYLPKVSQNYTYGFRTSWALNDTENWRKTNRLAAYLLVISGLIIIIGGIIDAVYEKSSNFYIISVIVILFVLIPTIYSYALSRRPK